MPTRRSSRDRSAASATPAEQIGDRIVMPPLSRRAVRERQLAEGAKQAGSTSETNAGAPAGDAPAGDAPAGRRSARRSAQPTEAPIVAGAVIVDDAVSADAAASADAVAEGAVANATATAPQVDEAAASETESDAFLRASRAFRDVPAVPLAPAGAVAEASVPTSIVASHVVSRRPRSTFARKTLAVCGSLGVMAVAGLMALSVTLPAEAVAAVQGAEPLSSLAEKTSSLVAEDDTAVEEDEIQAFVASEDVPADVVERSEDYSTASIADLAAERGIVFSSSLYTNDANAAIQWPFVVGVGMSSGFGQRWGRMHEGIDLVPGAGAPIQSIADGTVRIATESGGAYGVTVYIDHLVDGQVVTSHYSHMQYGSLRVRAGDTVEVGDIIGLVGNTGRSYGAHLHFELIVNGTKIDPLPWLQENAGRYSH